MAANLTPAQQRCWRAARRINREARSNPHSAYAGKWVGFADGRLLVVAESMDEMLTRLKAAEPDPKRCLGIEASRDYDTAEYIR